MTSQGHNELTHWPLVLPYGITEHGEQIGVIYGLLPDGTKPLQPMLSYTSKISFKSPRGQ